jgi:hypothetical protein
VHPQVLYAVVGKKHVIIFWRLEGFEMRPDSFTVLTKEEWVRLQTIGVVPVLRQEGRVLVLL